MVGARYIGGGGGGGEMIAETCQYYPKSRQEVLDGWLVTPGSSGLVVAVRRGWADWSWLGWPCPHLSS